ncbi:MAG: transcription termination/antitermination protein NusG [Acholeplasmatales bacterium]|jgi:transcriptional antiterminator NusG|nr:transcription termination/antitermination protein NusG [Acholeplasmatales bacterium]
MATENKKKKRWYIVQTYSGYEKSVQEDLMNRAVSAGLQEFIFQAIVPEIKIVEPPKDKNSGKEPKIKFKPIYPGYVFVEMILDSEAWFIVRNTPKVTGFIGSSGGGTQPVPVQRDEMKEILERIGIDKKESLQKYVGKTVEIKDGPYKGERCEVIGFDDDKYILLVNVYMFSQFMSTEVDAKSIKIVK